MRLPLGRGVRCRAIQLSFGVGVSLTPPLPTHRINSKLVHRVGKDAGLKRSALQSTSLT